MHAIEKIMANAANKSVVRVGEIVNCEINVAGINDLYLQSVYSFQEMQGEMVYNPEAVVVFLDHYAPASSAQQAQNQKEFREFCEIQGIKKLMDINRGVCHQVLLDEGLSKPGEIIVVTDSHTTTHGAVGAFGVGVGATDMATILLTGQLWLRVPEVIKICIDGSAPEIVSAKDIILHIIGDLKADFAIYKAIEFTGNVVEKMPISERIVLCNMTTEMGAKAAYIQPDEITYQFLDEVGATEYTVYETDLDYKYAKTIHFDISNFKPSIAVPSRVDNIANVEDFVGTKVNQAYIGSCTGGRLADLHIAANILKNKQINKQTRLLIVPASQKVLIDAMNAGYIKDLVEAGATLVTPGCAACLGTHQGLLAENEVCISNTNRNFPGRMGHVSSKIYLASTATVASSALNGYISAPGFHEEGI